MLRGDLCCTCRAGHRVEAFKGVARRRDVSLNLADRKKLIAASSQDLRPFLQAMLFTGCRPGELAGCSVGDLDPAGMLTVAGKTGRRIIPLSIQAHTLLKQCAGDRDVNAPLLSRSGIAWTRVEWRDAFQEARKSAQLSENVVMYSLRHVAISEMLVSGIDPMTVAKIAGTSTEIISRHYGHLIREKIIAQLSKVNVLWVNFWRHASVRQPPTGTAQATRNMLLDRPTEPFDLLGHIPAENGGGGLIEAGLAYQIAFALKHHGLENGRRS